MAKENNKKESLDIEKKEEVKEKKKPGRKKVVKEEPVEKVVEIREVVVERKVGFNYAEVVVIMIITLILGSVIGSFITYVSDHNDKHKENIVIDDVPTDLEEFVETYNNIVSDYYEEVNKEELLEAGINGMLEYLDDDYSVYMNQEESNSFNEQVEGKYTGIGVEIVQEVDGLVTISRVFDDTPASKAGLQIGDTFIKVKDVDVTDKTANEISSLIKGSSTKEVDIVVRRNEEDKKFTLTLEEVELDSVESKVFEKSGKKIGYIQVSIFAANTNAQFEKKLLELEGKNIDSLIIDVRDNSGGYLSTVTDMASLFMSKDKIIYQLDTKGKIEKIYSRTNTSRKYDIAVLINHNSASASEILAAALQESYGATIVGVNSYGKGTVQKAYQLESGATVKYTIQKWLTPDGNWINEVGVTPDVKVELDNDYYKNPTDESDNQLQKALEELSK